MKFTKSKFLSLSPLRQHKKCSELLRIIYEMMLRKQDISILLLEYNNLLSWMNLDSLITITPESVSDRFHLHLKNSNMSVKEHNLLPSLRMGDTAAKEDFGSHSIFLDNIRSAYNVGSIIRTTEALRLGSIYFSKNTPFIDNEKVIKTAMGTTDFVPCSQKEDLENLPSPIIALDTSDDAISIFDFIFPENFTLILGNEEYGISENLLNKANYIVEIPMVGFKNSLNVACAYAIAAAQIKQQQSKNK